MRNLFVFILVAVAGIAVGAATGSLRVAWHPWGGLESFFGGETKPFIAPGQPLPKLVVDQHEYDFGTMDIEEKGSHEFLVHNAGNALLSISKGRTSCHCTVSEIEQTEIPPGHSSKITINWKARYSSGPYRETASFSTNDPYQGQFTLTISGRFIAKFRAVPAEMIFNQILAGEPAVRQARLLCYQDQGWELREHQWEVAETAAYFQVAFEPLTAEQLREEPGARSGYLLKVTVKPGLPYGAFQQKIQIRTSLEFRPEIAIPIYGTVVSEITVAGPGWDAERGLLSLGIINSQQGIRHRLLLLVRGAYRKEVKFKPIESPTLPIKVSLGESTEIQNGLVMQTPLIIEIPKGSRSMNHLGPESSDWGEIEIETTHPEVPQVRIFVRFAVQE